MTSIWAWEHGVPADEAARVLALEEASVHRVFRDFRSKNRSTAHLREPAHTVEYIPA